MESEANEDAATDGDTVMKEPDGTSSPKELKNALYARCASQPDGTVFTQDELLSFGIVPENDVQRLLVYTKQLTKDGLFKLMTKDGKVCWRVVRKDDAAKWETTHLLATRHAEI